MSILLVRGNGDAFISDVHSGSSIGPKTTYVGVLKDERGQSNWNHICYTRIAGETGFGSAYLLLYRNDGAVYLSEMAGPTEFFPPFQIDQWENDWSLITPWYEAGRFLLYRRSDGRAFSTTLSVDPSSGKFSASKSIQIGLWDKTWAHLIGYQIQDKYFLILNADDGNVFITPVAYHSDIGAPDIGKLVSAGHWDTNWIVITNFNAITDVGEQYFLLFYRMNDDKITGTAFTAPIDPSGLAIIKGNTISTIWEGDWAHILQVQYFSKIG